MKTILQVLFCILATGIGLRSVSAQKFEWANKMGGFGDDEGFSISTDGFGNIYTTGHFQGTVDFKPGTGTYNLTSAGNLDMFISKLSSTGNFVWAIRFGSGSNDEGFSIKTDVSGNIYTTGRFSGTVDFDPGTDTFNLTSGGNSNSFISKLDTSGNFVWAKLMGGTSSNNCHSLTTDASGNIYTTGNLSGTADFDPGAGTFNLTSAGQSDFFVSKLDSSGNFIWAKRMGGIKSEYSNSITLDASGNIYTTGYFEDTSDFDPDTTTFTLTSAGKQDIFISKLSSSGNFVWAKKMGGTNFDYGESITIDASGNIYATGEFSETVDFNPDTSTFNLTSAGYQDIFISKLDTSGNFKWAKRMGELGIEKSLSITIDVIGNVYTTGYYFKTVDFDPGIGTFNLTSLGQDDVFITKLNTSGNFVWAKSIGGFSIDRGYCIATDAFGNIYTTGIFYGTADFDPGTSVFHLGSSGASDIFVHKMSFCALTYSTISPTACSSYTSPSSNYTWTTSGKYLDVIPNSVGCDSVITINLTINTVDRGVISTSPTLTAKATGATYQWLDCNASMTPIIGETNQIYTATANGRYAVKVSQNGCTDTSSCFTILNADILENSFGESLVVYPNPSSGKIVIDMGNSYHDVKIEVSNAIGQEVLTQQFQDQKLIELDFEGEAGIYFLTVQTGDHKAVVKVIKE